MEIRQPKTIQIRDYELSQIQGNVSEFANQFKGNQFLIGRLIDISISTTGSNINHGLQQTPYGWLILDKTANANVWRTSWDDKTISLTSSADVNVKLWVF